MTPKIRMPALRQLPRDPDRSLWRRLLQMREPVVYELVEDYEYATSEQAPLFVPAGFRTDLASTPRLSWLCGFRPDGPLLIPGLFHDWFYRHGSLLYRMNDGEVRSGYRGDRSRGDRYFRNMARRVTGLAGPAWAAWAALRLFGWAAWRANEKYRRAYAETGQFQLHGDYDD